MTPIETHSALCFICFVLFIAIGYQINKYTEQGYKRSYKVFNDYQHYRNYIFYLWCLLVCVGIAVVVTGSLVVTELQK